ncbi:multi-sensor signal transduction histidine kinase [Natronococcus amylolyticus DSM 10524]|uniref:histidine kinase n=1 Tax=Natronococcus amylolyticus DSM 10524 TaxID=1227497 RepID=L9X0I6_9EURY|nr:ATP-binding protein [Natronococcus amylolyticus]ELY54108.1 multi-sensor signal transduction histidine kinase [Natronococcus amylolyticus DSM 10524]
MAPSTRRGNETTAADSSRYEAVADLAQRALADDDLDTILQETTGAVATVIDARSLAVLERLPGGSRATIRSHVGRHPAGGEAGTVPATSESWMGTVLERGAVTVDDHRTSDVDPPTEREPGSSVGIRIDADGEPWGVLEAHATNPGAFGDGDVAFLERIADVLETALEVDSGRRRPNADSRTEDGRVLRAIETAREGIGVLESGGEFAYVNEAYAELYGYEPAAMCGMHWEEVHPPGMIRRIYRKVFPQLSTTGVWAGQTVGLQSDGTRFLKEHSLSSTADGGMVSIVRDVVERRRLESEFEEIYSRITDAVIGLDVDWTFTHVNDRAAELIGLEDRELLGRSFWTVFPDVDETFEAECRTAMEGQEPTSFEEYVPALESWLEVSVYPSETGLSIYLRDITDRKTAERELRESNWALRQLYEITADPERSFEEKVTELLELGRERLGLEVGFVASVDTEAGQFDVVHATANDRVRPGKTAPLSETYCRQTIETMEPFVLTDAPAEGWADDRAYRRWGFDTYVGCEIPAGDGTRTVCFADDDARSEPLTPAERGFVELAAQWLSYELERRHHQTELEELVGELEASNERLEQFAYAASHDLQEPLRMVTSYLRLIEDRYGDELDADGEEFLEYAVDGADRMREMIEGLLEYSRVDTRGDSFETVDLECVLEAVRSDIRVQIAESDAEITASPLPRVRGDSGQLRQLFQNLLSNAIKYSGDGPPRIDVSAERSRADGYWRVAVRDEGVGIDPEESERIFDVFQRLHGHDEPGAGIGLALCQRIVERHGGEIRVDSEPGEGSTFTVTLPPAGNATAES